MSNAMNFEGKWATHNCAEKQGIEKTFIRIMKLQLFKIVSVAPSLTTDTFSIDKVDIKVELLHSIN